MPVLTEGTGYNQSNGRFVSAPRALLFPSATATATTAGSSFEMGDRSTLRLTLTVSAASGTTPTLDVVVQTSNDGSTWRTLGTAFTQKTTTGTQPLSFGGADRYVRVNCTIGGTTPSFTFAVDGEAI